ncbi:MAG: hypothetical protein Fur0046_18040 [Cyanobacteria bacterium J069]
MSQQLKRWESPRRQGRNAKGKGGSARQRQLRKQFKALSQKLKQSGADPSGKSQPERRNQHKKAGEDRAFSPILLFGAVSGGRVLGRMDMQRRQAIASK